MAFDSLSVQDIFDFGFWWFVVASSWILLTRDAHARDDHTARKIGFVQTYSVQIWCKKVQTRGKSKDGKCRICLPVYTGL